MITTKSLQSIFNKATELHQQGEFNNAKKLYEQILQEEPDNAEVLHLLGLLFVDFGQLELAQENIRKAIKNTNDKPQYHNNLGNVYLKQGKIDLAQGSYKNAILIDQDYVEAYNNLASIYYNQGKLEKSIQLFHKLLQKNPSHLEAHYNLGLIFLYKKDLTSAKIQFNNVVSINDQVIQAHHHLGNIYLLEDNLDLSKKSYQRVLKYEEEHLETLNNMGVICIKEDNQQQAIDYFTRVLALDIDNLDARNNMAALFMKNNLYENALKHYRELLRLEPNNTEAFYNAGVAYMSLGHLEHAMESFEKVLINDNKNFDAYANLGAIYMRKNANNKAIEYFENALAINKEDQVVNYMLASITNTEKFDRAPKKYVTGLFDNYAEYYDKHMIEKLSYCLPSKFQNLIKEKIPITQQIDILDLGCGTGLVGEYVKQYANKLHGVDLSKNMLRFAKKRDVYGKLFCMDILEFLSKCTRQYNLVLSADVFGYFGDLEEIFKFVNKAITAKGYFLFSVEDSIEYPFKLEETGRFTHNENYILELIEKNNFKLIQLVSLSARKQDEHNVSMQTYLLQANFLY